MSRTANGLLLAGLALVLLLGFLLMLLPSGTPGSAGSVRSAEPEGRRALYLVLEELGYTSRAWTQAPGNLPRAAHVLYMPDTPTTPAGYEPRSGSPAPGPRRMRDPQHYLRFVEEGGTLITPVDGEAHLEFLTEALGLRQAEELLLVWREEEEQPEITRALLRTGEELELAWRPSATFDRLSVSSPIEALALDARGRGLAYVLHVGRGNVVLLAPADDWLNNDRLGEGDNALFFVRLIEGSAKTRRILFDEYALGGWVPRSPLALALSPSVFGFTVHLVLWGLLALWMVVWARPFARDPEPIGQVSALARAQGFAGMIAAAGRWSLLARMLRAGVMRRLSGRLGVRTRFEPEGERVPLALDADEVKRVLQLVLRGADADAIDRAHALLTTGEVRRAEELEELGERLAELERMVLVTERQE